MNFIYEPLKTEDGEEFFTLAGNRAVAATMRFTCPCNREESDRILMDYVSGENRTFALRFRKGDRLFGIFSFKGGKDTGTADLSAMLIPGQWGKGIGNEVIRYMTELAAANRWYRTLQCYILETNMASRKIAGNNGFTEKERHRFPDMDEDLIVYRKNL